MRAQPLVVEVQLSMTDRCSFVGHFEYEYSKSLAWKCEGFEGHDSEHWPSDLDQRMYARRREFRGSCMPIGITIMMTDDMLWRVINIATSEARDPDGLDSGVMWLRITRVLAAPTIIDTFRAGWLGCG